LINLVEFHSTEKETKKFGILEKGDGMEALLGSVHAYATHAQSLFLTPVLLLFIKLFSNETKIPQGYKIRQNDLNYYLIFYTIIIGPNMIIDIFMLHILEILHGYKMYDYFTYCDYKYRHRNQKWISRQELDKSIAHQWRSLDNMSFSS